MAGIFYFSSRPDPLSSLPSPGYGISVGNLAHIAEYAGLAALLHRARSNESPNTSAQQTNQRTNPRTPNPSTSLGSSGSFGASLLTTFAYALSDELHQELVPGRAFSK
ncbi:MAG: VanZ family protein [Anaerolineae bacterium]